ncbi:HIT family protein, partial [Klebsiella pneumoniae]|nr:HIT family protein [Klebsiella pneumoniae]
MFVLLCNYGKIRLRIFERMRSMNHT